MSLLDYTEIYFKISCNFTTNTEIASINILVYRLQDHKNEFVSYVCFCFLLSVLALCREFLLILNKHNF